jgi:hypothetical protein
MKTTLYLLGASLALVAACGDDSSPAHPDAPKHPDSNVTIDAPATPAPPTLGAQIDRMGRPAINTVLNHGFDPNATAAAAAKDTYNQDGSVGTWPTSYGPEIGKNLAVLDALDGVCGNQIEYNGMLAGQVGSAGSNSYAQLAGLLSMDVLVLETAKTNCPYYLSVEFAILQNAPTIPTCGGRKPSFDVIDASYSALAAGTSGFDFTDPSGNPKPLVTDGVSTHTDIDETTFPFLGTPHTAP